MTHEEMLDAASAAVAAGTAAEDLRRSLRHNVAPTDPSRVTLLENALEKLRVAMVPVRSAMGHLGHDPGPPTVDAAVRSASAYVQYQRKQLKKMLR